MHYIDIICNICFKPRSCCILNEKVCTTLNCYCFVLQVYIFFLWLCLILPGAQIWDSDWCTLKKRKKNIHDDILPFNHSYSLTKWSQSKYIPPSSRLSLHYTVVILVCFMSLWWEQEISGKLPPFQRLSLLTGSI